MNPEQFFHALKEKGVHLNEFQKEQFDIYYKTLLEWNEKINLTAITDEAEVYLKHFYDSITPSFFFNFNKSVHICDVGAGAGFPSIPLKICFPNLRITIVDSLNKRISFLQHLIDVLKVDEVSLFHSRAEEFGQANEHREMYDIVMARAVARMSVLSELCLPLVKKEGLFIALKGGKVEEEIKEGQKAIKILGGEVRSIDIFSLPQENSDRAIVGISKVKQSPKRYPRKPGTPNRKPIK